MYVHIIDRSNLDEVISSGPSGNVTRRAHLEAGCFMMRSDVVLITGTRSMQQHALYVTEFGYVGDLWILDILTDEQFAQVEGIAERMRANGREFPPARQLLQVQI